MLEVPASGVLIGFGEREHFGFAESLPMKVMLVGFPFR